MSASIITRRLGVYVSPLLLAAVAGGCSEVGTRTEPVMDIASRAEATVVNTERARPSPEVSSDLALLRRATARFHQVEEAGAAGYTVLVSHPVTGATCLADPTEGGMGRHLLNPNLVDDGVSVPEPEVVIYEPQSDGSLRLVGFEYVIPFSIRGPDETPPTLFGREFLHNTTFDLWMLHVYAWRHNPNGMFATWNPDITCEHDGAVSD